MPVFQRDADGSTARARAQQEGREVVYQLNRQGVIFLTEILGLRDGDEFRPNDLQLLIDRGWATPIEPERRPEPEPKQPKPEPEPESISVPEPITEAGGATPSPAPTPAELDSPRVGPGRRTRGREVALQVLYLQEQNPSVSPDEIERFVQRRLADTNLRKFTRGLVAGIQENRPGIDEQISAVAENWRLDRMAAIDRNILRIGAFEILHCPDVPRKVAINEALELAKRYSTAQSSRFVNGILDRLQAAEDGEKPESEETSAPSESSPADGG